MTRELAKNATFSLIEEADGHGGKHHGPDLVVGLNQTNPLPAQRLAEVDMVAVPLDGPIGAYAAHLEVRLVLDGRESFRKRAGRGSINRRGCFPVERLMRSDLVVLSNEAIETLLLLAQVPGRRQSRFLFERSVHSFVNSIVLR